MSILEGIQPSHLSRLAVIYIRQSSPQQLINNQESLKLQYHLVDRARSLGWQPDRVRVIDADLGRSGRSTDGRAGFQELVSLVNLAQVGAVFAYDVTRLARNCTDWYQLLDLCAFRLCLVGDQDGIYDPAMPNGRLILGLKGLISELELHTLRRRMMDGLANKARRGDLAQRLPAGLERDALGQVVKHPDQEVQSRLDLVFDTFLRLGTMSQVIRFFNQRGLQLPRRARCGDLVWRPPTTGSVYALLCNPAYAGAFVRGRRRWTLRGGKRVAQRLPMAEWPICVRDKYPAYIGWETFVNIQAMLEDNHSEYQEKRSRGVARTGQALLAGLLYCGECGHKLTVHYGSGVHYCCDFLRQKYQHGHDCQRVGAAAIDQHVAQAFLDCLVPAELEVYARAVALAQQESEQVRQARQQQLERLRYQAHLAERQYHRADPDNRLVAAELERRWEAALRDLRAEEETVEREQAAQQVLSPLEGDMAEAFAEAGSRITQMWKGGIMTLAQQKALLRCLLDKVVVQRLADANIQVRIVWKGGDTSTAVVPVAAACWSDLSFAPEMEAVIIRLAGEGKSDAEIATELTQQGYRSPRTEGVSAHMVLRVRLRCRVMRDRSLSARRVVPGFLTVAQLAERLKISIGPIYDRIYSGKIKVERDPKKKVYLFPDTPQTIRLLRKLLAGEVQKVSFKRGHQDD